METKKVDIDKIKRQRGEQLDSPTIMNNVNETVYAENKLIEAMEMADNILMKKYIPHLAEAKVIPIENTLSETDVSSFTRLFKIDRIVYDKKENNQDKLLNVYHSLYSCKGSLVLIMDSNGKSVDFYLGTKAEQSQVSLCNSVLTKSMKGNFPGTRMEPMRNKDTEQVITEIFDNEYENVEKSIAAVTGIASFREDKKLNQIGFIQGIEKLVDAMRGEKFSLVIIADPVTSDQIDVIRSGYENLYNWLVPFASTELNFGQNESSAVTESLTQGMSNSISENLARTSTTSLGKSNSQNTAKQTGWNGGLSFILNAGKSSSTTTTTGVTETWGNSEGTTTSSGQTDTSSSETGKSNTWTNGTSKSYQIRLENKSVNVLLKKIDDQLKRLDECNDLGMWNCSAYVVANDIQTSQVVASTYQALMRGENSGTENSAITIWENPKKREAVSEYLKKLNHPLIDIGSGQPAVSPAALLSGDELTIASGLPQKSIPGLPVYNVTSFGREIVLQQKKDSNDIYIGKINHMGNDEEIDIRLNCDSLAAHTFITGSTGSGKSNTIYKILQELNEKNIPFLVIEPAKGEYKRVFGNRKDVAVFGTNAKKTSLLKINPFKFPEDVHVLEHIDRLIEIFNVCWPMYAAMPAVLKDAVEGAYRLAGWDLDTSKNCYEDEIFPCFIDILSELNKTIDASDFSDEVKSNYRGALVTRIKSLTNGINGQVFSADEIDSEILFNNNTIVDLSRVASVETKALLMGILVMKLQEFRIAENGMNCSLRHVTVLEEAHNLLKRTSTEQSIEGANLLGKSVEMLSNSIAEMRTFGEGFIIADQSPNMLDLSAIRNTNTKIILRLPDYEDRELVGRAASLNEDQIDELTRLPTGIGVIYQNDWLEPVLCHVGEIEVNDTDYMFNAPLLKCKETKLKEDIVRCLLGDIIGEQIRCCFNDMKERILKSSFSIDVKRCVIKVLQQNTGRTVQDVSGTIAKLFPLHSLSITAVENISIEEWNNRLSTESGVAVLQLDKAYHNVILQCLIREKCSGNGSLMESYKKWTEYMRGEK